MIALGPGLSYLDLHFQATPRVIATGVLHGPAGVALVDPGPSSTLPVLEAELQRAGIGFGDLTAILVTHIHLDHAGACGTLARLAPRARIYVHEKGAPHLIDPAKLLASAERLWGGEMEQLWGEVRPVPPESLVILRGGERIAEAGRDLDVAYTPGHASHHVSYLVRDAGTAFVGDVLGVRRTAGGVIPPTPPPDIDLERWAESLALVGQWRPDTAFLAHFGPVSDVGLHISELRDRMEVLGQLARTLLERPATDDEREAEFVETCRRDLRRQLGDAEARAYEVAGRFDLNWRGLARYWRKVRGLA